MQLDQGVEPGAAHEGGDDALIGERHGEGVRRPVLRDPRAVPEGKAKAQPELFVRIREKRPQGVEPAAS